MVNGLVIICSAAITVRLPRRPSARPRPIRICRPYTGRKASTEPTYSEGITLARLNDQRNAARRAWTANHFSTG